MTSEPIPSTEGAAPDSGQTFVPSAEVTQHLANVAADRAAGWRLCAQLVSPPTSALVNRLRDGAIPAELMENVAWIGKETERFLAPRMNFEAFARSARHRSFDDDVAALTAEYARLWPQGLPWLEAIHSLIDLIDREADAWRSGDDAAAKNARVAEQRHMESQLIDTLPAWAATTDVPRTSILYRTVARTVVLYLSFESGRDFDGAIFRRHFPSAPRN